MLFASWVCFFFSLFADVTWSLRILLCLFFLGKINLNATTIIDFYVCMGFLYKWDPAWFYLNFSTFLVYFFFLFVVFCDVFAQHNIADNWLQNNITKLYFQHVCVYICVCRRYADRISTCQNIDHFNLFIIIINFILNFYLFFFF